MTPIISSGLVPSGVDIEGEREGRHTGPWTGNPTDPNKPEYGGELRDGTRRLIAFTADTDTAQELAGRLNAHPDLGAALRAIITLDVREYEFPADWSEQIAACPECERYKGHPIQQGICDTHRRPLWDREKHDRFERETLAIRMKDIARAALSKAGAS